MEEKSTLTSIQYINKKSRQHLRSMSDDLDNKTNTLFMSSDSYRPDNISILLGVDIKKNENKLTNFKKKLNLNIQKPFNNSIYNNSNSTYFTTNIPNLPKLKPEKRKNSFIPFTKVKSPFSMESRDMFLYKKIFYYFREKKKNFKRDEKKYINNKLNIDYAENEEAYEQRLIKNNIKLLEKGEKIKHFSGPTFSDLKLKELITKVKFMKNIVDYSYPDMVLFKVKQSDKLLKIKDKNIIKNPPFINADIEKKIEENNLLNHLNKAIYIGKCYKLNE